MKVNLNILFTLGDVGENFYIIISGSIYILARKK